MDFAIIDGRLFIVGLPAEEWERIKSLPYKNNDLPLVNAISEATVAKERNPASMNSINSLWRRMSFPYRLVGHPRKVSWSSKDKVVRIQRLSDMINETANM